MNLGLLAIILFIFSQLARANTPDCIAVELNRSLDSEATEPSLAERYVEPTDEQLLREINFEISLKYRAEYPHSSEIYRVTRNILDQLIAAHGGDPANFTLHVCESEEVNNAAASPHGHIWITRAFLQGITAYNTNSGLVTKDSAWSGASIEAIPLVLAHELGHQFNGDVRRIFAAYRKIRKDNVTKAEGYGASWLQVLDHELPGGRTYRQEVLADRFAVSTAEAAGFSLQSILQHQLGAEGKFSNSHPSNTSRGWNMGARSSRQKIQTSAAKLLSDFEYFYKDRSEFQRQLRGEMQPRPTYSVPWAAVSLIPDLFQEVVRYHDNREMRDGLRIEFQRGLLAILENNPSARDLAVLTTKLKQFSGSNAGPHAIRPHDEAVAPNDLAKLNDATPISEELDRALRRAIQRLNPQQPPTATFSVNSNALPELKTALQAHYLAQYQSGKISYVEYLRERQQFPLYPYTKHFILAEAKTPRELAEGYYEILRQYFSPKSHEMNAADADANWLRENHVIGSMYERVQRRFYDGDHVMALKNLGGFSDVSSPRQVVLDFLSAFARDSSAFHRSADRWPTGDIAGLLRILPQFLHDPLGLKSLLDQTSNEYFRNRPKPKARLPQLPFGRQFRQASRAYRDVEIKSIPENDLMFAGLGMPHINATDFMENVPYSENLAKKFYRAPAGTPEESTALQSMVRELDANRARANQDTKRRWLLEAHFMLMHPVKTFQKRIKLLRALFADAASTEKLPVFSNTGTTKPSYFTSTRHVHSSNNSYYESGLYSVQTENFYSSALTTVYAAVKSASDCDVMLRTFDFSHAPFVRWKIEMTRHHLLGSDPFSAVTSLTEGIRLMDQHFSRENPYRWMVFDRLWKKFGFSLARTDLNEVMQSALPTLNIFKGGSENSRAEANRKMLRDLFGNLVPQELKDDISNIYNHDLTKFFLVTQVLEREIYDSAQSQGLISAEPRQRLSQMKNIFRNSHESGASHPLLDQARLDLMRTLPIHSSEYATIRNELKDPDAITQAEIPLLQEALAQPAGPTAMPHDQQRDLIRKHLRPGAGRDRFVDAHLARAKGLTPLELQRYSKLYSEHPAVEQRKTIGLAIIQMDDVTRMKPNDKMNLVRFFLAGGNRSFLDTVGRYEHGKFLRVENYLMERHADDQIAFFNHVFQGDRSLLSEKNHETELVNSLLLAGEGTKPRGQWSLLSTIYDALYQSLDPWERGQLLSQLIVESRQNSRWRPFETPSHSPERAVRVLRLFKGFGPKVAQMLRSHRGILGDSTQADRYRDAFAEFEERAQAVDLRETVKVIERSFGQPFHTFFRSIDGVLGAGSIKRVILVTLNDGRRVALKHIDPEFSRRISHSLDVLRAAASRIEQSRHQFPDLPRIDGLLSAVESDIRRELNLQQEHDAYRNIRSNIARRTPAGQSPLTVVPRTHSELGLPPTDGRVIVEQAFNAISVDHPAALTRAGIDRNAAVELHITEQLEELLVDGFFDYDSRPANWTPLLDHGTLRLGYFDKAQGIQLNPHERTGLLHMLMAMQSHAPGAFEAGLRSFDSQIPFPRSLGSIVRRALALGNPYLILQEITFQLEHEGASMSQSKSLKLSMWLRQMDRYVQMLPSYDLNHHIMRIFSNLDPHDLAVEQAPVTSHVESGRVPSAAQSVPAAAQVPPMTRFENRAIGDTRAATQEYDHSIEMELAAAGIHVETLPDGTRFRGEVPTRHQGRIRGFEFQREWRYWVVKGQTEPELARRLYADPIGRRVIRVDGEAGNADTVPTRTVWSYHIDSAEGLKRFVEIVTAYQQEMRGRTPQK